MVHTLLMGSILYELTQDLYLHFFEMLSPNDTSGIVKKSAMPPWCHPAVLATNMILDSVQLRFTDAATGHPLCKGDIFLHLDI